MQVETLNPLPVRDSPLLALLRRLAKAGYSFTTPSPATHRRVLLRRAGLKASSPRDVFGWNMPFDDGAIDPGLVELMDAANILGRLNGRLISRLRVASIDRHLFLHSAFPARRDAVFFGPDSYRFTDFLRAELPEPHPGMRLLDIGAGSGVGGVFAAARNPGAQLILTDVNPEALRLARINAAFSGQPALLCHTDGIPPGATGFDLIVANPPYIGGSPGQTYSDGGGALGAEISLSWTRAAASRLNPGGRLLLYTGSAIVRGCDELLAGLTDICAGERCGLRYRELDPDVFPATLLHRAYWKAERIAAVGAVVTRRA